MNQLLFMMDIKFSQDYDCDTVKHLDRYISRQFLVIAFITLAGFCTIFLIVDLIENIDRFIDNNVPLGVTVKYYIYSIPWFINIALPMSMLLSTIFSLGLLVKRNEWTAMKSSGISLYRISVPLLIIGIFVSGISFQLDNNLVNVGNEMRFSIERDYFKMRSRARSRSKKVLNDVFIQKQGSLHIALDRYIITQDKATNATVIQLSDEILTRRLDAKTLVWVPLEKKWATTDYSIRLFSNTGAEVKVIISSGDTLLNLEFTPEDLIQPTKSPEELNYSELTKRIATLKENGVNTSRWEVTRAFKISFAFTNFIVILFGLPLVVLKTRGGLTFGAGMSVFVIFAYYAFIKFGQSLGFKEILEPFLAAWLGNIIFVAGGILLMLFAKK